MRTKLSVTSCSQGDEHIDGDRGEKMCAHRNIIGVCFRHKNRRERESQRYFTKEIKNWK